MHPYASLRIHTHTYAYICIHTHTYAYICIPTHTYAYLRIHMHTYAYIHMQALTESERLLPKCTDDVAACGLSMLQLGDPHPHPHPHPHRGLSILQLGDTAVGDAGAAALSQALLDGAMPDGQQLWLAATPISPEGRAALMAATVGHPRLRICW